MSTQPHKSWWKYPLGDPLGRTFRHAGLHSVWQQILFCFFFNEDEHHRPLTSLRLAHSCYLKTCFIAEHLKMPSILNSDSAVSLISVHRLRSKSCFPLTAWWPQTRSSIFVSLAFPCTEMGIKNTWIFEKDEIMFLMTEFMAWHLLSTDCMYYFKFSTIIIIEWNSHHLATFTKHWSSMAFSYSEVTIARRCPWNNLNSLLCHIKQNFASLIYSLNSAWSLFTSLSIAE